MRRRGFTLLEVVVAMSILVMALMAIFDLNAGAVATHSYTKKLTVASLLARSKMTDLEQTLYDEGLPSMSDEEEGDFSEEGWPSFKWRSKVLVPKTDGVPPERLVGALFNLPMGEGDSGDPLAMIGALMGGGAGSSGGGPDPMAALMGPAMGLIQGQIQQIATQITDSVREVQLTVYWKDGRQTESIDLVTHVVAVGTGGDRNSGGGAAGSPQASGTSRLWMNPRTQQVVPNPRMAPNGKAYDPQSNEELVPYDGPPAQTPGSGPFVPDLRGGGLRPPVGIDGLRRDRRAQ
jgi:general secretion pathway protein I